MRRIDEDIKTGQFKNLYLLYGEEEYLKQQYKNKLLEALVNDGDTMNFAKYEGKAAINKGIVDLAETVPFFAKPVGEDGKQYRVILIEESELGTVSASKSKNSKADADVLLDYLSEISESTIFIFVETKADKKYRLFKAANACDRACEMKMPSEADLAKWIGAKIKLADKQMKKDAWERFLMMTGDSMNNMDTELEKLISYMGDRQQITVDDVNAICIENTNVKIYELADAMAEKNARKTFDIYHEWMAARVEPRAVLGEIIKLYNRLKLIKEMDANGKSIHDIAAEIRTQDYYVKVNLGRAKRFKMSEIDGLLNEAAEYSYKINTGQLNEKMAVELLMLKYAGDNLQIGQI
mgnify:CR=1 FL=1